MAINRDHNKQKEIDRRLAGLIAQMPEEAPPPLLTAAVMRRLRPKQPSRLKRLWLAGRRTFATLPAPAVWGGATAATSILIAVAALALFFKADSTGPSFAPGPGEARQVTFVLDRPSARHVAVIGSFNQWNPQGYALQRESGSGFWRLTITLPPGQYTYAFVIDHQQTLADPNALWLTDDGFGGRNATLIVANGAHDENNI